MYGTLHSTIFIPITTFPQLFSIPLQLLQTNSRQAMSRLGLGVQAVSFLFVAASWLFRFNFPYEKVRGHGEMVTWWTVVSWYEVVGWASVDGVVCAVG